MPPIPTRGGRPEPASPRRSPSLRRRRGRAAASSSRRLAGRFAGQEALGHPHRTEAERRRLARQTTVDADELHRPAAEVEHAAVGERGRVDRREIAVACFLLAGQDADRAASRRLGPAGGSRGVVGVADRAGRDRLDLLAGEAVGVAELGEHVGRRQGPARSAPDRASRSPPGPRRSGPPRRSRRSASTSRRRRVKTTRRKVFDPRSITASCRGLVGHRRRLRSRHGSTPPRRSDRRPCPGRRPGRAPDRGFDTLSHCTSSMLNMADAPKASPSPGPSPHAPARAGPRFAERGLGRRS